MAGNDNTLRTVLIACLSALTIAAGAIWALTTNDIRENKSEIKVVCLKVEEHENRLTKIETETPYIKDQLSDIKILLKDINKKLDEKK